jgi:predicted nuclease of predicted toxin-antitoxin system
VKHLLIDENLPASIARILPVDSSHATDVADRPSDRQLWDYARSRGWNILTRDTDFFDRIMLDGSPPKVIWVRLGNIRKRDLEAKLLQLWPSIVNLLEDSDLVEIHPDSLEAVKKTE